jgi:hypothetical protein
MRIHLCEIPRLNGVRRLCLGLVGRSCLNLLKFRSGQTWFQPAEICRHASFAHIRHEDKPGPLFYQREELLVHILVPHAVRERIDARA